MKTFRLQKSSKRRGAVLPMVAIMMTILLGCVAFSVDIAYIQLVKLELKSSVDAAARAGGEALSRQQNLADAKVAAKNLAVLNVVAQDPLLLEDDDIIPGHSTLSTTTGKWNFTPFAGPYNSIRVIGRRTDPSPSGNVPLFFGKVFGWHDFEVQAQSTVVRIDRDILLVVDRSSSMKLAVDHPTGNMSTSDWRFPLPPEPDSRWVALEAAVHTFVNALQETPQVEWLGLVSYASNYSRFGVNNTEASIDEHLTETHSAVNSEMAAHTGTVFNGLTHISKGIDEGVQALFHSGARPFAFKTMVLMTDGIPNPANTASRAG